MPRLLAHEFEDEVSVVFVVGVRLWLVEIFDICDGCLRGMIGLDGRANGASLDDLAVVEIEATAFDRDTDAVDCAVGLNEWGSGGHDCISGAVVR